MSKRKIKEVVAAKRQLHNFNFLLLTLGFRLFQANCLNGTNVHTDAAIDAGVGVYHSLLISHAYCLARAFFHTRLAACAFLPIYFSCHYLTLSKKQFTGKFIRRFFTEQVNAGYYKMAVILQHKFFVNQAGGGMRSVYQVWFRGL